MSQAQIEQFYGHVSSNPALANKLATAFESPQEFLDKAVAIGKEVGYSFTQDEAAQWLRQQAEAERASDGELSDLQLEAVAGGKGACAENAKHFMEQSAQNGLPISTVRWAWQYLCYSVLGQ